MKKTIGYGVANIPENELVELIKSAYETGYDYIDTAWFYKNEDGVGNALYELKISDFKIQTKIWPTHFLNVEEQFNKQLKSLRSEKIWSLLLHRPSINFEDSIIAWKELIKLKEKGLVERIGVSNFDKDMIKILIKETGVKPEINQIETSIQNYREDRIKYCESEGIEIQSWSPLGTTLNKNKVVAKIAKNHSTTWAGVALAFLYQQGLNPIVKSANTNRIKENIDEAKKVKLTNEDIKNLLEENIFLNKYGESFPYSTL
ncbi:MAG: aldo/keto reductase [Mycoplasma sp.]|nr:aldo/keto reductase [Mycoplasma sp.]